MKKIYLTIIMLALASPALGLTVFNFPDLVDALKNQSQPVLKMMEVKAPAEMVAYLQQNNLAVNARAYILMTNLKTIFGADSNTMKINLRSGNNIAQALGVSNALKENGLILTMSFMNDQLSKLGNLNKAVLEVYLNSKLVAVFKNVLSLKDNVEYSWKKDKNNIYTAVATHKIHTAKTGSNLIENIKVPVKYQVWFKIPYVSNAGLVSFSLLDNNGIKVAETDKIIVMPNQPLQNFTLDAPKDAIPAGLYSLMADVSPVNAESAQNFAGMYIYTSLPTQSFFSSAASAVTSAINSAVNAVTSLFGF